MCAKTQLSGSYKHPHDFTGLWWHFGPYGPQDVHVHDCFKCSVVLIGEGRNCDGRPESHQIRKQYRAAPSLPERLVEERAS